MDEVDERDTLQRYGPYECYRDDKNEPMFRQWKVRNLASLFEKEEGSSEYTLEQFKEWLKRTVEIPENEWTYINIWGMLDKFLPSHFYDNKIHEYLFQLGKNPGFTYLCTIRSIESFEEDLDDPTCDKEFTIEILDTYRELLIICEKYITKEDKRIAISLKDTVELY